MPSDRQAAVVRLSQGGRFANLCRLLREPGCASRLSKPLYYWALASDRHLPSAVLGWTLEDFLATSFESLCATPGLGPKKRDRVLELLQRAARNDTAMTADPGREREPRRAGGPVEVSFAPDSELAWDECRRCVLECGLGGETLARFAPSLRDLPRRIWHSRLSTYAGLSLAEIRALPSVGPKRERALLETFGRLFDVLRHVSAHPHLQLCLRPRHVALAEDWVQRQWRAKRIPGESEICSSFIEPLCEQVRGDADESIAALLADRLSHPRLSIQHTARRLGFARSSVYESLFHVASIIDVRWPAGRALVEQFAELFDAQGADQSAAAQFRAAKELFFPALFPPHGNRRNAG